MGLQGSPQLVVWAALKVTAWSMIWRAILAASRPKSLFSICPVAVASAIAAWDCYEVAGALRAAARFLEVLNQLPGTPAVRDWQGDADELINIADALTEEVAADFADQDAQN